MVHTISRRTFPQKILLPLVLLIASKAFAYDYGLGVFVMNIEDKLELSIESRTWYDKSTGRIIGERKHHSRNIKDRTNRYVPFFYWKAKYIKMSFSDKYQDIRLKNEHRYIYYGVGLYRLMYNKITDVTESWSERDCAVSCSYLSTSRTSREEQYTERETVRKLNYIASFGLKYKNWYFDFDQNANFRLFSSLSF